MGYDIHVTNRADWSDTETAGISLEAWLANESTNKTLELTKGYNLDIGEAKAFHHMPGYCTGMHILQIGNHFQDPWFA